MVLAIGAAAAFLLVRPYSIGFLQGALTLGGGIVICGLFSLSMRTHGFVAAGVLGLLGAARGLGNLPGLAKYFLGDRPRGVAPLLELAVTVVSFLLLAKVVRHLYRQRIVQMLEEREEE